MFQEINSFILDPISIHDVGMGLGYHIKISHPIKSGLGYCDLAIIYSGDKGGKPGIKKGGIVTGNDANRIIDRSPALLLFPKCIASAL